MCHCTALLFQQLLQLLLHRIYLLLSLLHLRVVVLRDALLVVAQDGHLLIRRVVARLLRLLVGPAVGVNILRSALFPPAPMALGANTNELGPIVSGPRKATLLHSARFCTRPIWVTNSMVSCEGTACGVTENRRAL